jgi:mannose/fructose/N-acetylgalactosamine-specific phosphotransferase system component IIB
LLVKSIADAAEILNDVRYNTIKMLVLVNCVKDAFALSDLVQEVKSVNFGGIRASEGSKPVSKAVSLTDDDRQFIKQMDAKGLELEIRQVPGDKKQLIMMEDL